MIDTREEHTDKATSTNTNVSTDDIRTNYSEQLTYEATKVEYDHCIQRAEKLDNKIYILLTVYAFLFVLLCDIIKKIDNFSFPKNNAQLALIIIYAIFFTAEITIYIVTLVGIIRLLKGVSIERFSPLQILELNLVTKDSKAVVKYICSLYNKCIDANNSLLEKRYRHFNVIANCTIPVIIGAITLIIISEFIA